MRNRFAFSPDDPQTSSCLIIPIPQHISPRPLPTNPKGKAKERTKARFERPLIYFIFVTLVPYQLIMHAFILPLRFPRRCRLRILLVRSNCDCCFFSTPLLCNPCTPHVYISCYELIFVLPFPTPQKTFHAFARDQDESPRLALKEPSRFVIAVRG